MLRANIFKFTQSQTLGGTNIKNSEEVGNHHNHNRLRRLRLLRSRLILSSARNVTNVARKRSKKDLIETIISYLSRIQFRAIKCGKNLKYDFQIN